MNRKLLFLVVFMVAFFIIILGPGSPALVRNSHSAQAVTEIFSSLPDDTNTKQIQAERNLAVVIFNLDSLSSLESHLSPYFPAASFQQRVPALIARYLRLSMLINSSIRDIPTADRIGNFCRIPLFSCCRYAASSFFLTASLATRLSNG
jgi:hypothetical protein